MEAGTIRRGDPDVVVHFLWSLTHGLVTLELSCRLHEGSGGGGATAAGPGTASEAPSAGAARCPRTAAGAPLELYRHFHSLVEFGLRGAPGSGPPAPGSSPQPQGSRGGDGLEGGGESDGDRAPNHRTGRDRADDDGGEAPGRDSTGGTTR